MIAVAICAKCGWELRTEATICPACGGYMGLLRQEDIEALQERLLQAVERFRACLAEWSEASIQTSAIYGRLKPEEQALKDGELEKLQTKSNEARGEKFLLEAELKVALRDWKKQVTKRKAQATAVSPTDTDGVSSRFIPLDIRQAVWERDQGRCVRCAAWGPGANLQFDHVIPFSKGGANTFENLQVLCRKCNLEKSNYI
jgi:5-methylcytosine-specific restriction endonuclease McrA